jgi:hypothetical protein
MKFASGKKGFGKFCRHRWSYWRICIFYKKENGFAVVNFLGKDMNPTNIMTMMSVYNNLILI